MCLSDLRVASTAVPTNPQITYSMCHKIIHLVPTKIFSENLVFISPPYSDTYVRNASFLRKY